MARNGKYFRVKYYEEEDRFAVECSNDCKEWDMVVSCVCQRSAKNPDAEEANFVSYRLITEICKLIEYGYKLVH